MKDCVDLTVKKETFAVSSEQKRRCDELLKQYKKHMRLVLRNQQEAYFCLLELLNKIISDEY